jgi:diphosphate-dependent phosphofructokinase
MVNIQEKSNIKACSDISSSLIDKFQKMKRNNSFLESELRQVEVDSAGIFKAGNGIQQIGFQEMGKELVPNNKKAILNMFHSIVKQSGFKILKGAVQAERITGKKIAVLFSGGPAAGGHNVVAGIKHILGDDNTLYGVQAGPKGLLAGNLKELSNNDVDKVLNLGGFDLLGSDRTKIKTREQFEKVLQTVKAYKLDGIIIIGGDDSNTNAAFLAEYLFDEGCAVIGVPKTIDGDLQSGDLLPITFGFDTATKIYSELVGNILQDTPSSRKYWHFIKLMGRSASHVALEVALQTKPTITLISEEIAEKQMSIDEIIEYIAEAIAYRAGNGINHGVVLVPEGVIEFIPAFKQLIDDLNEQLNKSVDDLQGLSLREKLAMISLSRASANLLGVLPDEIATKLLMDRDSHGNLQVSQIPTEDLLIEMVTKKIEDMKKNPDKYFGPDKIDLSQEQVLRFINFKFATNSHFFGYEGRCGAPSCFDAAYGYNLGLTAGALALNSKTGYMASLTSLEQDWQPLALPLTGLISEESRKGSAEMVIKKALIELDSPAFQYFCMRRQDWAREDLFTSPGPRQFWGPIAHKIPFSVALNQRFENFEFKV